MSAPAERLLKTLARHVHDQRVLEAVRTVPRDAFVPEELRDDAWENVPLPIGAEQTISQPLVVARMLELLELAGDERVLDVGTGSGYHAALLARLCAHVWSIEVHQELSERAAAALAAVGIDNVTLLVGDGALGWPEAAPFDAINVAAAAEGSVPEPLLSQLAPGGRLVAPVERRGGQYLALLREHGGHLETTQLERVRFVPLVG
jgi:protein-L-isoaspartate(D-aspartate) O-methyltransferase